MDVKTFATELARSLMQRGIPREIAVKHSVSLVRTFDEEDLREISSYTVAQDFADLSDSLCELIKDKEFSKKAVEQKKEPEKKEELPFSDTATRIVLKAKPSGVVRSEDDEAASTREMPAVKNTAKTDAVPYGATREIPAVGARQGGASDNMKTKAFSLYGEEDITRSTGTQVFKSINVNDAAFSADVLGEQTIVNIPVPDTNDGLQEIYLEDVEDDEEKKVVLTKRGKAFFWSIAILTMPLTALAAFLVLAVFALGIIAVCTLIAAVFILVCAQAVAGCGLLLVGLIYGVIVIIGGNVGTGIYEIGLGVFCSGVALGLGVLTYYLASVVLPYALKQLITFEGYSLRRVGPMLDRFREECNRL